MTKFQTIKRFASKTEGMNFTEVYEDMNCKQVDVVTSKYSVRITAYKGMSILGVAIYVAGDLVFKRSADSQKEAVQFIEEHVDRIASEHIEQMAIVSDCVTGEDMLYRALHQFSAFEISAEQCLSLIYKALDNAQTKEERDNIKDYAIMFSERIASGYYKSANVSAEEPEPVEPAVSTELTEWVAETSVEAVVYNSYNHDLGVNLMIYKDLEYNEVTARFTIKGECKNELFYEKPVRFEVPKRELERLYNEYVQAIHKGHISLEEL